MANMANFEIPFQDFFNDNSKAPAKSSHISPPPLACKLIIFSKISIFLSGFSVSLMKSISKYSSLRSSSEKSLYAINPTFIIMSGCFIMISSIIFKKFFLCHLKRY